MRKLNIQHLFFSFLPQHQKTIYTLNKGEKKLYTAHSQLCVYIRKVQFNKFRK